MMPPPNHWNLAIDYFAWWRDFADTVSQVEMGDHPGLAHLAQCNCEVPTKREAGETGTAVEDGMSESRGCSRARKGPQAEECGRFQRMEKQGQGFPLKHPEGMQGFCAFLGGHNG